MCAVFWRRVPFYRKAKLEGPFVGYPEPSIVSWPVGDPDDPIFFSEFDPFPTVFKKLTGKEAGELAAILQDKQTYSLSEGGKLCVGFHADVAIAIPSEWGHLYILVCFTCDEIQLQKHGSIVAAGDIALGQNGAGRNRLLEFMRSAFPKTKEFKKFTLAPQAGLNSFNPKQFLEFAETIIPDDPLLKHLLTLKPEEISDDNWEELDVRCTAELKKQGKLEGERYRKERAKADSK